MLQSITQNPIMRRLTRQQRKLAVVPILMGLTVALATIPVLTHYMCYRSPERMRPLSLAIWIVAGIVVGTAPGIIGSVAARMTFQERRTDTHQLIRVSALPRRSIVEAHVAGVIVRLRGWLALFAGLTPALLLGTRYHTNAYFALTMKVTRFYYMMYNIPSPRWQNVQYRLNMIGWQPEFAGWAIALWGMVLLAIVIGVGLGFRIRSGAMASFLAALVGEVGSLLMFGLILAFDPERAPLVLHIGLAMGLTLAPVLGIRWLVRVVPRWV